MAGSPTQYLSLTSGATCTPGVTCGKAAGTAVTGTIAAPGGSKPNWCGRRTDEMFTMTFSGCAGDGNGSGATVTIAVIHPDGQPDTLTFACDAPEATVQALFGMTAYPTSPKPTAVAGVDWYTGSSTSPSPFSSLGMTAGRSTNMLKGIYADNGATPWALNGYCVGSTTAPCAPGGAYAGASSSVKVTRSGSATNYVYTVGYWDPVVVNNNWYTPQVIASTSATVAISTFQDGGITMAMNGGWVGGATAQVMSFFLSTTMTGATYKFAVQALPPTAAFTPGAGTLNDGRAVSGGYLSPAQLATLTTDLNTQIVAAGVTGQAAAGAIASISQMDKGTTTASRKSAVGLGSVEFVEYQITFATVATTPTYLTPTDGSGLRIVDAATGAALPLSVSSPTGSWAGALLSSLGLTVGYSQGSALPAAWVTTFQTYNAAPLQGKSFYNQPSTSTGDAGTGNAFKKITCYTRFNAFQPQSFYSGSGNGGVVSDVLNRPYAIGYSVLGEAISRNLNVAKMINKAGSVVNADANSGKQIVISPPQNRRKRS